MQVAVIGTGYVGLVSGACLADFGHTVTCLDVDETKIAKLKNGEIPIYEPGLEDVVRRNIAAGRLLFTTSYADAVPKADLVTIAVGTPSADDGSADLSYFMQAASDIAKHMNGYKVIVDKSTVPVGTADKVRELVSSIYKDEFDVVSNPEFLREGHAVGDFMKPDRIIIGSSSERASKLMLDLYASASCPKLVMSTRSAELTKYAANSFLATKISFINEIAHLSEELGADIREVSAGIGSDSRIGPKFLQAGLGWGGSCFPKDVSAIQYTAKQVGMSLPVIEAATKMNDLARSRVVDRLQKKLGSLSGKRIALLGLAFKGDTDDTRESASLALLKYLHEAGAMIRAFDPAAYIPQAEINSTFERVSDAYAAAQDAEALILATEWDEFKSLDLPRLKSVMKGNVLMDARNVLDRNDAKSAGFDYLSVGHA